MCLTQKPSIYLHTYIIHIYAAKYRTVQCLSSYLKESMRERENILNKIFVPSIFFKKALKIPVTKVFFVFLFNRSLFSPHVFDIYIYVCKSAIFIPRYVCFQFCSNKFRCLLKIIFLTLIFFTKNNQKDPNLNFFIKLLQVPTLRSRIHPPFLSEPLFLVKEI